MTYKKEYFQTKMIKIGSRNNYHLISFEEIFNFLKETFPKGFQSTYASKSLNNKFNKENYHGFEGANLFKKMVGWGLLEKQNLRSAKSKQPLYFYKFLIIDLNDFYSKLMKEEILEVLEE